MAGPRIAHVTLKGPSVVKEILIGIGLGIAAGAVWKTHHWKSGTSSGGLGRSTTC
ncbi:hypothetical protein CASFOL_027053 [Castilleja foliolosa]|uniref:Cytochrome c oxidase subunit 5C n=1 Tax=Castilleja foliolosa TaxID=1961234 RepID=A0ABD3CLL3_9LAMI